jgi:hypothetical protein
MIRHLAPIDVTQLAADLTGYLHDRGAWDVGSGGPVTVTEIAEFIAEWASCDRQNHVTIEATTLNEFGDALSKLIDAKDQRNAPFCMPEYRR